MFAGVFIAMSVCGYESKAVRLLKKADQAKSSDSENIDT
jgi:hypothetical protein